MIVSVSALAAILLLSNDASAFSPSSPYNINMHRPTPTLQSSVSTSARSRSCSSNLVVGASTLKDTDDTDTVAVDDEGMSVSSLLPNHYWDNQLATEQHRDLMKTIAEDDYTTTSEDELFVDADDATIDIDLRDRLKRELARVSLTNYAPPTDGDGADHDHGSSSSAVTATAARTAEDIMKELEQLSPLPILQPATHHSLNADWSFVFTGVPTLGMQLITILSRMSVVFPFEILDFRDVLLCVTEDQTKAKAVVSCELCGLWEFVLEVCTSLRRPTEEDLKGKYEKFVGEDGTLLLEHFQGIWLNGIKLPTPEKWSTTRTLEITYMDKDIMIARTAGGEPHLMLRNTPLCYSPEDAITYKEEDAVVMDESVQECSIDGEDGFTEFFSEAIELYGERITRCLVDRDFGKVAYDKTHQTNEQKISTSTDDDEECDEAEEFMSGLKKDLSGGMNLNKPWWLGGDK